MHFVALITVLPFLLRLASAIPHSKRTTYNNVTLYAYGPNITGLAVHSSSSDSLGYITTGDVSNYSPLTWDISNSGTDEWNATTLNGTAVGAFYLVDGTSTFEATGFISSNSTAPTNASTSGFSLFGGQVVFISDSTFKSQFWAQSTEKDGVWALMWNSDGSTKTDSIPVALKTVAPLSLE